MSKIEVKRKLNNTANVSQDQELAGSENIAQ
jgi:hypothetical protein